MVKLNKLLTLKREALRRELHRTEFSREDKRKSFKAINNNSNGGGGSVSKYAPRYFKIDFDKADTLWKTILGIHNDEDYAKLSELIITVGALYKIKDKDTNVTIIQGYPFIDINTNNREHSFSYMPLILPKEFAEAFGMTTNLLTFEDMLENISKFLAYSGAIGYPEVLSTEGITEITEEEFYKID